MLLREKSSYKDIVKILLNKMPDINRPRYTFMIEIFGLFLSIKGRMNFLQFERYGNRCEQSYRSGFGGSFDFLGFNQKLFEQFGSRRRMIAFDPSYVRKSGKSTPGVGYFWSGVAGATKWGLEIAGIAAVDLDARTAYHLEAVQTPSQNPISEGLLAHYTNLIVDRKEQLSCVSNYVVADAYFSKHGFVTTLKESGFEVISRLRNDADLLYLYKGSRSSGRGRPKQYDGKIDFQELKEDHFTYYEIDTANEYFHGIGYSRSLKCKINLVVNRTQKKGKWTHKLYFTTDLEMQAKDILEMYGARFQIEFLFRDAKQHTGLDHCQARGPEKLHFHWNAALTSVNLAKVAHWSSMPEKEKEPFSMADVKTLYHNKLMLERFLTVFGIRPDKPKNKKKIRELLNYGARAA